jgi:zinc metalloprotease ZmpB
VRLGLTVKVPEWLGRLGWKFSVPQITKDRAVLKPDQLLKVNVAMTKGKPYDTAVLAKQADHDIVFTVLQDDMPVGGMTYRLSTDVKPGLAAEKKVRKSAKAASRKTAVVRSSRSRKGR